MCGRFSGLSFDQMLDVARDIQREAETRLLTLPFAGEGNLPAAVEEPQPEASLFPDLEPARPDSFPGMVVPVAFAGPQGVQVANLNWGYRVPWNKGPVFNARVETALEPGRTMWAESLQRRRCLVAAYAFYEPSAHETVPSPRTGKPVKRQYRFALPSGELMFLASVYEGDAFSIMTCEPNRWVAPVHPRMPLALHAAEAPVWLSRDYAALFDRSAMCLEAV